MAHVARLYRSPVKGFSPQAVESVTISKQGAVEGDRVLGFLLADAPPSPDPGWWRKIWFLTMQNTPGLAHVGGDYDPGSHLLRLSHHGSEFARGDIRRHEERDRLAEAVTELVLTFSDNPLAGRRERLPLQLVGDGDQPRFHDRQSRDISLVGSASIAALAAREGVAVDERRFRMNITVEGLGEWEELGWQGSAVQVGDVELEVIDPCIRCLATHANPVTGERDLEVMTMLQQGFDQERPTMGVIARPRQSGGGVIRVGDPVTVSGG